MTDAKALRVLGRLTPEDLGLKFEAVTFMVRDEATGKPLPIAGWWMPADQSAKTVIVLHGFADAKVGAIAWAPLWRELGYNVLAIDLRAHGESGGEFSSAGFYERHDVSQVIDQLKAARPAATRQVALFGLSLGSAVAAATAAMRDDLAAVVLDSPFTDYRRAVRVHAKRRGMPGAFVSVPALKLAEWIAGGSTEAVKPAATIPKITCPVLIFAGGQDPFCTPEDLAVFSPHAPCHVEPGAGHLYAYSTEPEKYRQVLSRFLSANATIQADRG
jgi:pimeloyl-ACP methyl ester carboxylesterase